MGCSSAPPLRRRRWSWSFAAAASQQLREQGKVIASFEARREKIVALLQAAAQARGAQVVMPEALIEEVSALVEWPVVYELGFEEAFLAVPQSCLILTMQQNQKYFALQDAQGRLQNRFLLVSNIDAADPSAIIAGNARVVRARLADAKFFFDQDRLQPLQARLARAANVVYHAALGSQRQRIDGLVRIAGAIAAALPRARRRGRGGAGGLAGQGRPGTLMVGEFPSCKAMGTLRAPGGPKRSGGAGHREHYRPRLPATPCRRASSAPAWRWPTRWKPWPACLAPANAPAATRTPTPSRRTRRACCAFSRKRPCR